MGEKQKENWEKQVREKEIPTFAISLARARALARHFSFWPCDEDSCFSTSWEICCKFPFAVQCSATHDLNKIRKSKSRMKSRTKSRRNVSTLLEAFPIMTPFALRYRFPKTFQPYIMFFLIFNNFFAANWLLSLTKDQKKKLWKFWPDFVDSNLDVSTSRNSEWKDVLELTTLHTTFRH